MNQILLFVKDFELGTKISTACVDSGYSVDFSDEDTDPDSFKNDILVAFVDLDEKVFSSVGLVSELKRRKLNVVGIMSKIKNKERSKLQYAGCEIIFPKSSVVNSIPKLLDELSSRINN
tara:strand:- start:1013 stop:1369 length:357 start_codon:yes stop_codon:yes gene_type:complete